MRQLLGDDEIETVEEQLNSPCVEEIAAFDNFVDFMDSPSTTWWSSIPPRPATPSV